jgi:hypothetical protein
VQLADAHALLTEHAHRQDNEALSGRFARNGYPSRTALRLRSVERTVPFRPAPNKPTQNGGTIAGMAYATLMFGRMTKRLGYFTLPFYVFTPARTGPGGRVASPISATTGRT